MVWWGGRAMVSLSPWHEVRMIRYCLTNSSKLSSGNRTAKYNAGQRGGVCHEIKMLIRHIVRLPHLRQLHVNIQDRARDLDLAGRTSCNLSFLFLNSIFVSSSPPSLFTLNLDVCSKRRSCLCLGIQRLMMRKLRSFCGMVSITSHIIDWRKKLCVIIPDPVPMVD